MSPTPCRPDTPPAAGPVVETGRFISARPHRGLPGENNGDRRQPGRRPGTDPAVARSAPPALSRPSRWVSRLFRHGSDTPGCSRSELIGERFPHLGEETGLLLGAGDLHAVEGAVELNVDVQVTGILVEMKERP